MALKLPCSCLNSQGSSPFENPLIATDDRKFFDTIMRYSLKMPSLVQYSVGFGLLASFFTGRSTRFLIGPSIRRLIGFPCLIAH
ncbi:hypothetical protein T06_9695 [Trichinella sp. T6]|nr:hypothetical protein T06_9695 [Trichinella sp. T6]